MSTQPPAAFINVTKFSDIALQAQIDAAIASLPPDKSGAVIVHGDLTGVNATVVLKKDAHWTIDAGASYTWAGQFSAGAAVAYSW
jgi:hypothetical protein